jgi:hypothetical protein
MEFIRNNRIEKMLHNLENNTFERLIDRCRVQEGKYKHFLGRKLDKVL